LGEVSRGSQDRSDISTPISTNDEGSVQNVSETADEELAAFANL
jgi:hypothetical protein